MPRRCCLARQPGANTLIVIPDIVGRVLQVAGQPAHVAGVNSDEYWRLPGRFDAWLLEDERSLAALSSHSKGFVLARMRTSAFRFQNNGLWRMSLPNRDGGYDGFDCVPLANGQPILGFLFVVVVACLILPATTSLSLGEYPANSHSPPWATRFRVRFDVSRF